MSTDTQSPNRFRAHCNYCCEALRSPDGVMTSCQHFFCHLCAKRLGESCLACRQRCRTVSLRNLPQSMRTALAGDSFRQLALTAQAVQWQFGQHMINLAVGSRRLTNMQRHQDELTRRSSELQAAIDKLESENAQLKQQCVEKDRVGAGDFLSSSAQQPFMAPPSQASLFGGDPLFPSSAADTPFAPPPRSLFGDTRPPTSGTTFTSLMGNVGL